MHPDLLYRIALTQVLNIGPVLAKNLISYCGSAGRVFVTPLAKLLRIPQIGEKTARDIVNFKDFSQAEEELIFIEKQQVQVLFYADAAYPQRLKQWSDAPVLMYYLGNADLNTAKIVAVVGTRNASAFGKVWTEQFIHDLKPLGCLVLSGLAYGIDIAAHKAAVKAGVPTVGVMGNGLKTIYPAQHQQTAKQMTEHGGLLTEYISGTPPDRQNFPNRNRIVAAMSDAIVVVETKKKGGSMITAGLANQYNKDVFAIPGKPGEEVSEGCNYLIKTNRAGLIESAADLVYQMGWDVKYQPQAIQPKLFQNLNTGEQKIYDFIKGRGKAGIDDLYVDAGMAQHEISMLLLELELKDVVRSLPGKYYELKYT